MNGVHQRGYGLQSPTWLSPVRAYMLVVAVASLIWELAQLPLYTIWTDGTTGEIAFAVLHCTVGDLLIAAITLLAAAVLTAGGSWPARRFARVATLAITFGLLYTVFSEWLNVEVRRGWAYSELMPTLPLLGTGLSPLAQWIAVPVIGFWWARRASVGVNSDTESADR
jgi:hypothetical protein